MHIDWASLAAVGVVVAAAALTVVLLVSFAVVGLSTRAERSDGPDGDHASGTHPGVARPSQGSACSPPGSSSATACM
jgi:hypothetical protein